MAVSGVPQPNSRYRSFEVVYVRMSVCAACGLNSANNFVFRVCLTYGEDSAFLKLKSCNHCCVGPKDTDASEAAMRTVQDGDLPTALEFKKGIFSFLNKAPSSQPKGSRTFSSGACLSSGSSVLLPRNLSHLAARQSTPSWQGFAASSLRRYQ